MCTCTALNSIFVDQHFQKYTAADHNESQSATLSSKFVGIHGSCWVQSQCEGADRAMKLKLMESDAAMNSFTAFTASCTISTCPVMSAHTLYSPRQRCTRSLQFLLMQSRTSHEFGWRGAGQLISILQWVSYHNIMLYWRLQCSDGLIQSAIRTEHSTYIKAKVHTDGHPSYTCCVQCSDTKCFPRPVVFCIAFVEESL